MLLELFRKRTPEEKLLKNRLKLNRLSKKAELEYKRGFRRSNFDTPDTSRWTKLRENMSKTEKKIEKLIESVN